MRAVNFKDIVESNGKTVQENNLAIPYEFAVGDKVSFTHEESNRFGATTTISGEWYVVDMGRDCDGTPLYSICATPCSEWDDVIVAMKCDAEWFKPKAASGSQKKYYGAISCLPASSLRKV